MEYNIKLAVILGSGLDIVADSFAEKKILKEESKGIQKRKIYIIKHKDTKALVFTGRKHFYEGYSKSDILSNIRITKQYDIQTLLLTNAAGGLNENFEVTDIMLISSHLNLNQKIVSRSSMQMYNEDLKNKFLKICTSEKIYCREGIYCCLQGPAYETNSEIKMLHKLNVDAVGMSTVPEIIEASSPWNSYDCCVRNHQSAERKYSRLYFR